MNKGISGLLIVLVSSLLYACNSLISKILLTGGISPLFVMVMRYGIATLFLFSIIVIKDKTLLKCKKEDFLTIILLGVCLFINAAGYFFSLLFLDLSIAVVLLYTFPAMIAIASTMVFKEPLSRNVTLAVIFTFIGILLTLNIFSMSSGKLSIIGVILGFSGAVGSTVYAFTSKKLMVKYNVSTINFYSFLITFIIFTVFLPFAWPKDTIAAPEIIGIGFSAIIIAIAFLCYNIGIKYLNPSKAAIICSSEPAVSIILAAVVLKEAVTLSQGFGAVFVILAIIILQLPNMDKEKKVCQK